MNDLFVNIKVDREERPDVDAIYMSALHELGEQGGWPLTMFLTSDAEPFWGGTYFPKDARYGRPAFTHVLKEIARIYRDEQDKVRQNATALKQALAPKFEPGPGAIPGDAALEDLARRLLQLVDPTHGGIRGAPKFPQPQFFTFLWRAGLRYGLPNPIEAVTLTLTHIAQGGIYDHLGGGFARYSVDERWLVPHFEKMLYDNALLLELMTEAWRETGDPLFAIRVSETIDWLMREMVTEGGGFASSLDADSEGEEGKFYVWSLAEIEEVLGAEDAKLFAGIYDVTPGGNFEGHTILNRINHLELGDDATEARLAEMRAKLLARRASRIRPGFDDKVLADWNGLMIAALAKAAEMFVRVDWLEAAERAFDFVSSRMIKNGRLLHSYRAGEAKAPATATDYANMIKAALALAIRHRQSGIHRARPRMGRRARPALLGGRSRRIFSRRRRHRRSHRAHHQRARRRDAERERHHGVEPDAALSVDRRGALSRASRGNRARLQRRRRQERVLAYRAAHRRHRSARAGAYRHRGAARRRRERAPPRARRCVAAERRGAGDAGRGFVPANSPAHGKTAIDGKPTAYVCIGPQCSAPVTEPAALVEAVREGRERKRLEIASLAEADVERAEGNLQDAELLRVD